MGFSRWQSPSPWPTVAALWPDSQREQSEGRVATHCVATPKGSGICLLARLASVATGPHGKGIRDAPLVPRSCMALVHCAGGRQGTG